MESINNEKFGRFLSQLRKEKGWTQKQLAQQLFISDKAVSKWERGLSLPDISLLQPIADIFAVTVTELLSGQRIGAGQPMSVKEVDPLLTGALLSAAEEEKQAQGRRRWGCRYLLCLLACALFLLLMRRTGYLGDPYAAALWLPPAMGACFGIHFIFLAKGRLPAFYDEHPLCFYSEGMFRMNMPGIAFNNRSWPHILRAARCWCCAAMACWPPLYWLLRRALALLLPSGAADLPVLLAAALSATLGGLMIPIYITGKKHQ